MLSAITRMQPLHCPMYSHQQLKLPPTLLKLFSANTARQTAHLTWNHPIVSATGIATIHWTVIALDAIGYAMSVQVEAAGAVVAVVTEMIVALSSTRMQPLHCAMYAYGLYDDGHSELMCTSTATLLCMQMTALSQLLMATPF